MTYSYRFDTGSQYLKSGNIATYSDRSGTSGLSIYSPYGRYDSYSNVLRGWTGSGYTPYLAPDLTTYARTKITPYPSINPYARSTETSRLPIGLSMGGTLLTPSASDYKTASTPNVQADRSTPAQVVGGMEIQPRESLRALYPSGALDLAQRMFFSWVVCVLDKDTIIVADDSGAAIRVRLLGVDASDLPRPASTAERSLEEVRALANSLLEGQRVCIIAARPQGTISTYGGIPAFVYRMGDGLFVNAEIAKQVRERSCPKRPVEHQDSPQVLTGTTKAEKGLVTVAIQPTGTRVILNETAPGDTIVYLSTVDGMYHKDGCSRLDSGRIPMMLSDAADIRRPCPICNPPVQEVRMTARH